MKIAIVGAGIAGLALGCFLQKYQIQNKRDNNQKLLISQLSSLIYKF